MDSAILPNKGLRTDVFVLDSRDPSGLSFIRAEEGIGTLGKKRKLEMPSNRLSAFKIININPLRYNYYINNQLVTSFTDAGAVTTPGATFTNGVFLPVNDIGNIQLLSLGTDNSNQKVQLITIQNEINTSMGSLKKLKDNEKSLTDQYINTANKKASLKTKAQKDILSKKLDSLQTQIDELGNKISESTDSLSQKVSNFETTISRMNINSHNQSILEDIGSRHRFSKNDYGNILQETENKIGGQAISYLKMASELDSAELLYNQLSQGVSSAPNKSFTFRSLKTTNYSFQQTGQYNILVDLLKILASAGYYSQNLINISKSPDYSTDPISFLLEGFSLKVFITNKKFSELEGFILTTCEELAKLLQNKYVYYSRSLNSVKIKEYISSDDMYAINEWREDLTNVFNYFQDISSDFIVLTKFLSVDNSNYKDLLTSITSYYLQLLSFMKNFDYIHEANSTMNFTLSTSNNLTNVDLIRYNVERDDKLTNGKQTYVYDVWLKGGLKVDFSAGIFGTGLIDAQYSKLQLLRPDSSLVTGDTFAIKKQDAGSLSFAFGGMVNIYPRLGANWLTAGLSVGVVYSNNQKLQFLLGGGLHFGKTERLILHGGVAVGVVKRIDLSAFPSYYDNKNAQYIVRGDMSAFNIPVTDKFIAKPFIGISYNLSKKNALNAVSEPGQDKYNSNLTGSAGK